jgi:hypothetical protein
MWQSVSSDQEDIPSLPFSLRFRKPVNDAPIFAELVREEEDGF